MMAYPKKINPFILTLLIIFIIIFGGAFAVAYYLYKDAITDTIDSNRIKANLLSSIILEHEKATAGITQSYSNRPLFIKAVKKKDLDGVIPHLTQMKENNSEIDLVFITDPKGVQWANLPFSKESQGRDFSYRDWYKGVSKDWKPYVSGVFQRMGGEKELAVGVCSPIFDEKGKVIGILGTSQRVDFFAKIIHENKLDPDEKVTLIDQNKRIIYSNRFLSQKGETDDAPAAFIKKVWERGESDVEIRDPSDGDRIKYLAFVTIKEIGWSVIIEKGKKEVLKSHFIYFIQVAVISSLVFSLITLSLVYSRKEYKYLTELQSLSSRLLTSQEEERKRIASEIHDSIGSSLSAIKFSLESQIAQGVTNPESLKALIPKVQQTIEETRGIMAGLRPSVLDDLGIVAAISWFCREFQNTYPGIHVEKQIDINEDEIPGTLRILIFRVMQEAFHNISKHSNANLVKLSLRKKKDTIELSVQDNGQGFDLQSPKKGLGLDSMRERTKFAGGSFTIESTQGTGSIIRATWPIG